MSPPTRNSFLHVVFAGGVPREGGDAETTEDRFAVSLFGGWAGAAVADGASDGIFSDRWAALLVENAVASAPTGLRELRRRWRESFSYEALPWHMQTRAARGASAAFVLVHIFPGGDWYASGIGDCLMLQMRGGRIAWGFPFSRADDFPVLPVLLHTSPVGEENGPDAPGGIQSAMGQLSAGDELLLMSDALAYWFLREAEEGKNSYNWLSHLSTPETFAERVRQLRTSGRLKDDDTTLVHLRYSGSRQ